LLLTACGIEPSASTNENGCRCSILDLKAERIRWIHESEQARRTFSAEYTITPAIELWTRMCERHTRRIKVKTHLHACAWERRLTRVQRFQGTRVHEGRDLDATVRGESKEDAVTYRITRVSSASSLLLSGSGESRAARRSCMRSRIVSTF
jgi:hypothetical protein